MLLFRVAVFLFLRVIFCICLFTFSCKTAIIILINIRHKTKRIVQSVANKGVPQDTPDYSCNYKRKEFLKNGKLLSA